VTLSVLEICAGGGGQALGLEEAGFELAAAVEIDEKACATLRANRPKWRILESDVREVSGRTFRGVDLFAGGVPCPPFSIAGKQLGRRDERDLFPEALRLIEEMKPAAVMLENVRGFASEKFKVYRRRVQNTLARLGYESDWRVVNAASCGVPQLRPRFILVAFRGDRLASFAWPGEVKKTPTVGEVLADLMAERRWRGAKAWARRANGVAPTLVGGSKKHGGPDLGPTRAKREWAKLGVDGHGVADEPPGRDFPSTKQPRLTVRMTARIQGFPDDWNFVGAKTAAYRQIGNAFPPPVARLVGQAIRAALIGKVRREPGYAQGALFHGDADVADSEGNRVWV